MTVMRSGLEVPVIATVNTTTEKTTKTQRSPKSLRAWKYEQKRRGRKTEEAHMDEADQEPNARLLWEWV